MATASLIEARSGRRVAAQWTTAGEEAAQPNPVLRGDWPTGGRRSPPGIITQAHYSSIVGAVPATTYNPTHLDVRQWIQVAHELGAKYAVLTAKYMSGFCLWDSKGYDYDVSASGNKTDVVEAFVAACKEFGLRAGFYYCILDPHNEGKFDGNSMIPDRYIRTHQASRCGVTHALTGAVPGPVGRSASGLCLKRFRDAGYSNCTASCNLDMAAAVIDSFGAGR